MAKMAVNAPKVLIGMVDGVKLLGVLVAKSGIRPKRNVNASLALILTGPFAYFVLMGKHGIVKPDHVSVQWDIYGTAIIVKGNFILSL